MGRWVPSKKWRGTRDGASVLHCIDVVTQDAHPNSSSDSVGESGRSDDAQ